MFVWYDIDAGVCVLVNVCIGCCWILCGVVVVVVLWCFVCVCDSVVLSVLLNVIVVMI